MMNFKQRSKSGLTGSDILDIRRLHDVDGMNDAQLGRQFNVSRKTIWNIVERNTWAAVATPKSVRGYNEYTVYPDGRVQSKTSGSFISQLKRSAGPAVRIRTSTGARKTVPVATLLKTAKFI